MHTGGRQPRHKDAAVNVERRNSIHHTADRLSRDWEHSMLASPAKEFPGFPAALACLPVFLLPDEALRQFERRAEALTGKPAGLDAELAEARQRAAGAGRQDTRPPRFDTVQD